MRFLLDTHTVLWALLSPQKLGSRARALVENPRNTRIVSSATAWEIATKYQLGKLAQAEDVVRDYSRHLVTMMAEELAVTSQHALAAGLWETIHRDPFDRMLAAQCFIEGIALVTNDASMSHFSIKTIW